MNIMRWGANVLEGATPVGLIFAGAALALTMPPVRRGLRSVAVAAAQGVIAVADTVQGGMAHVREEMEDIVAEARIRSLTSDDEAAEQEAFFERMRGHGRRVAVSAAGGAMAMRDEVQGVFAEARSRREAMSNVGFDVDQAVAAAESEEPGVSAADLGDEAPRKKRPSRSKML